jgi:hypothetical protein
MVVTECHNWIPGRLWDDHSVIRIPCIQGPSVIRTILGLGTAQAGLDRRWPRFRLLRIVILILFLRWDPHQSGTCLC